MASMAVAACQAVREIAPAARVGRGQPSAPVFDVGVGGSVTNWLALGPLPNPAIAGTPADGVTRAGYNLDYLAPLGGEAKTTLRPGVILNYDTDAGTTSTAPAALIEAAPSGIVRLDKCLKGAGNRVAYAQVLIRSDRDQEARVFFGANGSAKVWVDGALVHSKWQAGSGICDRRAVNFSVKLRKGLNPALVKVEAGGGRWEFAFELYAGERAAQVLADTERLEKIRAFQNIAIRPRDKWRYIIEPGGEFPELVWDNPELVESLWGRMPLAVRWFDAGLNEVKRADKPGRYGAYVEGVTTDGRHIRRSLTIYCAPAGWDPWVAPVKADLPFLRGAGIDQAVWTDQRELIGEEAGDRIVESLTTRPDGPVLLAGLAEMKPLGRKATQLDWPMTRDLDYHLALKLRVLGLEGRFPALKPPHLKAGAPAAVLRPAPPAEAGMKADTAERLRRVCKEWAGEGEQPFTALVARGGKVVFHEAFGSTPERPIDLQTRFPLASLTKTFTGLMFAQFMDQGIIDPDDPVGKYLPDFPVSGPRVVTVRECLNHTTGLTGHGEWGGMANPWLDNVVANGLDYLQPGRHAEYNGMGFDLTGRLMEVVSGKSIFRLMHENFFAPLGMSNATTMVDMAFGIDCTVEDLARMGQLMLNKGSYGAVEFFTPETFAKAMPQPFARLYPNLEESIWGDDNEYGFGISWMRQADPRAGKDGVPKDRFILSRNLFGHGAASSAVLRVDPDHDLVIAVSRFTQGKNYGRHLDDFLMAVEESLAE
ncbi:MAG: beta-lactamase family protein [bacterium]|nr:beta-lactamase family protein [bacterium]